MQSYWDHSWASIDPERIQAYVKSFPAQPDAIMQFFRSHSLKEICDAGCGCGIYALLLAKNGFSVRGFDVAQNAVRIANSLFTDIVFSSSFKCANILSTGYESNCFDGVICRDVPDHMQKRDAFSAIQELMRITRSGGCLCITLDALDEEYQIEPHTINEEGDYLFSAGKWNGMVFHPYAEEELFAMLPPAAEHRILKSDDGGFLLFLHKK